MPIIHSHRQRPLGRAYSKTNGDKRQQVLVLSTRHRAKGPLLVRDGAEKVLVARLFFFQGRTPYAPTKDEAQARSLCYLRPGFVDQVERSFGGAAEAGEAAFGDHFAHARFASLRAERGANFLRK